MSEPKQNISKFAKGMENKLYDKVKKASTETISQNALKDDKCTGIKRRAKNGCCPRCLNLEGDYTKDEAREEGAYSIHSHDGCTITPTFDNVSPAVRAKMDEAGKRNTLLSACEDDKGFKMALDDAKENNEHGGYVDTHSVKELATYKKFLSSDGMCGVAIKTEGDGAGDITCVFKNDKAGYGGAIYDLIIIARENGGVKMDCYGERLTNSYEKCGFEPVARVKFDPQYVDDPLLLEKEQDIYFLKKTNKTTLEVLDDLINKNYNVSEIDDLEKLPLLEYDEACKYRDYLIKLEYEEKNKHR